ncbi:MAG: DoxX family protein [Parasphingopyxis sp.]|uniref:DoxX family protein n=1 Tax=Parasphingopyxis sp. TaxID=1920299 RepID=UPI003F9FE41D
MTKPIRDQRFFRFWVTADWLLRHMLAAAFFVAAAMKILGLPYMVGLFDDLGASEGFRYLVAAAELLGAALLLSPKTAALGTALLMPMMVIAAFLHIFALGGGGVPALLLLTGLMMVGRPRLMPGPRHLDRALLERG